MKFNICIDCVLISVKCKLFLHEYVFSFFLVGTIMKVIHRNVHGSKCHFTLRVSLSSFMLFLLLQSQALCCPDFCKICTERQVNCRGLSLTGIPRNLPKSTTVLYFSGNNITQVISHEFREIPKLALLYLDNCNIRYIHSTAFIPLTKLYHLYLNDNCIKNLEPGIFDGLSDLHYLQLQNNQIAFLPQGLFNHLKSVQYLMLQRNCIRVLNSDTFFGMTSLRFLNLANNNLSIISSAAFHYIETLEYLFLENNQLMEVPSPALGMLKNLKKLSMSNNPLGSINQFAFKGLDSLQYLFLENANINIIKDYSFDGLINLKYLILSKNNLTTLNSKMFTNLKNLLNLQLERNNIMSISENAFEEIGVSLKFLNLAYNKITILQPKVLQPLISLGHFQASYNPWDCGCHLFEFRKFLVSSSFLFSIYCHTPPHLHGRPLRNVKTDEFKNFHSTYALPKRSQPLDISAPSTVFYGQIKNVTLLYNASLDVLLTSTISAVHESTTSIFQQTTELSPLHLDLPPLLPPVNLTRGGESVLPPDIISVSLKPNIICQQEVESLSQSFYILLSFFIASCCIIIFLILKYIQLRRRLRIPESRGESVLEYYSCYQAGRYQLTDPIRLAPSSDVDIIRPLKRSTSDSQTQVILFEHSVL
ncbi:leucine-rich repeat-containing protein 70 [Bombina bombina]|uniref:leucine-rich repeat-containing protein 70 n=1 Tax=Bombina bombina TaxID=8345 RepID=UPI00235B0B06|nr:leucine-rich repeat-containing protein 70 [Bombina bombina]